MVLRLEVFESAAKASLSETVILDAGVLEETKLASYDAGYSAGWEDAAAAQAGDQATIGATLARNLQGLSFTYNEARGHILRALEPLLEKIVGRLLPELARETLGAMVLETLMPIAERLGDRPVTLVLNPASRSAVEALLETATGFPIQIVDEPSLGEGQVYLRFGTEETLIDLDRATTEIATAVRGFFDLSHKDNQNG
jgi:flagellar assembly protein FliH